MNAKKYYIIGTILLILVCSITTFVFTRGFYIRRITAICDGTQQSISDAIGTADSIGNSATVIRDELGLIQANNEQLRDTIKRTEELNEQLRTELNEIVRLTEDYTERSAAYSTDINGAATALDELLDTAIRKSELYEEYFRKVQSMLNINGEDSREYK